MIILTVKRIIYRFPSDFYVISFILAICFEFVSVVSCYYFISFKEKNLKTTSESFLIML